MRSADAATIVRVLIIVLVAYLIIGRMSPFIIIALIAIAMAMDAADGFMAVNEISGGRVGLATYVRSLGGDARSRKIVRSFKEKISKRYKYGARIDVAGDRAVEYILWLVYTYVNVIPLFVLILVIIRHSFVDAVMASKGTSSRLKTKFAMAVYSSNIGRGGINVVKFLAFSYLSLVYIAGYPAWIGYVLVFILVAYILLRGAAELYEAHESER